MNPLSELTIPEVVRGAMYCTEGQTGGPQEPKNDDDDSIMLGAILFAFIFIIFCCP